MKPGYAQNLSTRDSWLVEFDRGGDFGTARYTVTAGTYKFVATDRGWDLVKDTLDTADSGSPRSDVKSGLTARIP